MQQFFQGPNVWSPVSGLLLGLEQSDPVLRWVRAERPAAALVLAARRLLGTVPVAAESRALVGLAAAREGSGSALDLLLATVEVLMRDFCVVPAPGRLVEPGEWALRLFVPCEDGGIGFAAWQTGCRIVETVLQAQPGPQAIEATRRHYWSFRKRARDHGLNQTNIALARAAALRGIPHERLVVPGQYLQFGQGRHRRRVLETGTDATSAVAMGLSGDKLMTATILARQGLPTSEPRAVRSSDEARSVARQIGFPVVVKPRSSGKGRGVTVHITDEAALEVALRHAAGVQASVLVERHVPGDDHRLLVVAGCFVAAARRLPARVTGDGRRTVRQLMDELNRDPRRGMPFERLMEWVTLDHEATTLLGQQGLEPDSVPAAGAVVVLRRTANLSRGGSAVDVTDSIHPDNRRLAERVAGLIGLDVTGIDFLTDDIGRSWREGRCAVLEVNATPGLRPHLAANPARDVVGPIVDQLFPARSNGRVPVAGITGSVGKTTTARMLAHILATQGRRVALSTTQGSWVDGDLIRRGDRAGGGNALAVLQDPRVDVGVFELARGGLVKRGLGVDRLDVGAVMNVYDNHLGLDGVHTREELARVKRLVVENTLGLAVLNADDPLCLAMRPHVRAARLGLVSTRADHPAVVEHRAAGGLVGLLLGEGADAELVLYEGAAVLGRLSAGAIPASWDGQFRPVQSNALFAAMLAHGLGVGFEAIGSALSNFHSTIESNPGRMNLFEGLPYRVLCTSADGSEAMGELVRFVRQLKIGGRKLALVTAVGNRPDAFLRDTGRAMAGGFARQVCSDRRDLRGRAPGEVARLLAEGLRAGGAQEDAIELATDASDALDRAHAMARPGDLLVLISYDAEEVWADAVARAS
jgi:cyanophycin synthetase